MKLKFVKGHKPKGSDPGIPDYKIGDVVSFDGQVAETYARKYVERGYAVEYKDKGQPFPIDLPDAPAVEPTPVDSVKDFRAHVAKRGKGAV